MYLNIEYDEYIFADSICIFGCTATDGPILNFKKKNIISIWPQPFIPHSKTHTCTLVSFFPSVKPNRGISGQNRIVCLKILIQKQSRQQQELAREGEKKHSIGREQDLRKGEKREYVRIGVC